MADLSADAASDAGPDPLAVSDLPGEGADRPPEERGTLTVAPRAVESIVRHAARGVAGTVATSTGPRLLGRRLPSADATLRGQAATVSLDVAAAWPCRAQDLASTVRDTVRAEVERSSGLEIGRVDVTLHVVTPDAEPVRRVR